MSRISEAVARPARGIGQGGVGYVVVELLEAFNVYDFTERQWGISVIALGALFSFLQNTAENRGWITPLLRTVPPKEVEVP